LFITQSCVSKLQNRKGKFSHGRIFKEREKNKKNKREEKKKKEEKKVQVFYFVTKRYYSTVIKDTSTIVFCISYHRSHTLATNNNKNI